MNRQNSHGMTEDGQRNDTNTPLYWTDGRTTKYIELLNCLMAGLMSVNAHGEQKRLTLR